MRIRENGSLLLEDLGRVVEELGDPLGNLAPHDRLEDLCHQPRDGQISLERLLVFELGLAVAQVLDKGRARGVDVPFERLPRGPVVGRGVLDLVDALELDPLLRLFFQRPGAATIK